MRTNEFSVDIKQQDTETMYRLLDAMMLCVITTDGTFAHQACLLQKDVFDLFKKYCY